MRNAVWAAAGLLTAVLVVIIFAMRSTPEPSANGKTLSFWLKKYSDNFAVDPTLGGVELGDPAQVAIRKIGTNALPVLLHRVRRVDLYPKRRLLCFLQEEAPCRLPWHSDDYYHYMADCGFSALGPVGKPAVPALVALLRDRHPEVRACAAHCLGGIGPGAAEAIPALLLLLNDRAHRLVIWNTLDALGGIHQQPDIVIPALMNFVNRPLGRWRAIKALEPYHERAKVAIPSLKACLTDPSQAVRTAAMETLNAIDPAATARAAD